MHQLEVKKLGVILGPTDNGFESKAVLNPGVYQDGTKVHVFYRAIDGRNRSSIGYAQLEGPTKVVERRQEPVIYRDFKYESKGVEDPRITKIGKTFYLLYTAHDGKNAVIAYATANNLDSLKFKKHGVISPQITYAQAAKILGRQKLKDRYFMFESYYSRWSGKNVLLWEKDAVLFSKKIRGKFALFHRILPDIQIAYFKKFDELKTKKYWREHLDNIANCCIVLENKYWFESRNIGGGVPPIETKDGWLVIYHAVEELNKARIYHAAAALLDKNNPTKMIGRLNYPLFSPEKPWEKKGFVDNVVFPTGATAFDGTLYIYYGAADQHIAVAAVNINALIRELKRCGP